MPPAKESSMKRLAASLVFAALVLAPAVSFAQKPTTRALPGDATCQRMHCTDMCALAGGVTRQNSRRRLLRKGHGRREDERREHEAGCKTRHGNSLAGGIKTAGHRYRSSRYGWR